jgi:hypothetical protein
MSEAEGAPSDACGAAGPSHYVQTVNDRYAVFDKYTGQMLHGFPKPGYSLYANISDSTYSGAEACRSYTNGDTTVLWDQLAERWVFSEFAWIDFSTGPFFQVVFIVKTCSSSIYDCFLVFRSI